MVVFHSLGSDLAVAIAVIAAHSTPESTTSSPDNATYGFSPDDYSYQLFAFNSFVVIIIG